VFPGARQAWIYYVGPVLGALVAAKVCSSVASEDGGDKKETEMVPQGGGGGALAQA